MFIGHLYSFCEVPGYLIFFFIRALKVIIICLRTMALEDLAPDWIWGEWALSKIEPR